MSNLVTVKTPSNLVKINRKIKVAMGRVKCTTKSFIPLKRKELFSEAILSDVGLYGLSCYGSHPVLVGREVYFEVNMGMPTPLEGVGEVIMVRKLRNYYYTEIRFDALERESLNFFKRKLFHMEVIE